jgi:hypothetical protein
MSGAGAAQQIGLLRVVFHRLGERALREGQVEQLAKEIDHVAHLAVLEHLRHLLAHLLLGGRGVHPLDEAEARAEQAREEVE